MCVGRGAPGQIRTDGAGALGEERSDGVTRQLTDAVVVTTDGSLARAPDLGIETITPKEM